jgi:protein required for attachment to host cells
MRIRIVVADQAEARFYDTESADPHLRASGHLSNPDARLHERDLVSDRPGRVFDRATPPGGRRGAVSHHATGGERTAHRRTAEGFARRIALELQSALREGQFDRVVLMANPRFLGMLRQELPEQLERCVVAQVPKDLVHQGEHEVSAHLPAEALR